MELGVLVNRPLIDYKSNVHISMKNPDLAVDHELSSERSMQLKII